MSLHILKSAHYSEIIRKHYADAPADLLATWAKSWNVSKDSIRHRAAQLGVRRSEAAKGAAISKGQHDRQGTPHAYEAPLTDRDAEYVAACIAQGGFPVLVWIKGEPRTVYRREWAA
jgi:hypothetical protein